MGAPSPRGSAFPKSQIWLILCVFGAFVVAAGMLAPAVLLGRDADKASHALASGPKGEFVNVPEAPGAGAMLLRLVLGTVVVLVLCVATLFGARRWLGEPTPDAGLKTRFAVVESLRLGRTCWVHLVRSETRGLLIGVDGGGLKAVVAVDGNAA
jgi:hypothetical protein